MEKYIVATETNAKPQNITFSLTGNYQNYLNYTSTVRDFINYLPKELLDFTGTALRFIAKLGLSTGGEERGIEEFTEDYSSISYPIYFLGTESVGL